MKSLHLQLCCTALLFLPLCGRLFQENNTAEGHFSFGSAFCQEMPKEGYYTKTYVDTLILRAFYKLNAATAYGDFQDRRQKAIAEAKRIANKLRHVAKNDPNSRYILWKVGELEGQIMLEEEDILQENERNRQKMINHLVTAFNRETGKKRPDFANLVDIHSQMLSVDGSKAAEIEWLIRDRARGLSRDVQRNIETALDNKQLHKAQMELDYCSKNLKYLSISLTTYSKLAARLKARVNIDDEKSFIANDLQRARLLLLKNELAEAANVLTVVDKRLGTIKGEVSQSQWEHHAQKVRRMNEAIGKKEDSLVTYNIDILNVKGVEAAMDYLDNTLTKEYGVSREKIGVVNNAVIRQVLAEQAEEDTAISEEIAAIAVEEPENVDVGFGDMALQAKQIAQERQDSIRAEMEKRKPFWVRWRERRARRRKAREEEQRMAALKEQRQRRAEKQRKAAAEKRKEEARLTHVKNHRSTAPANQTRSQNRKPSSSSGTGYENSSYQKSKVYAYAREEERLLREKEEKAKEQLVEIYTLLEQDQIRDAYEMFRESQNELKKYIYDEAYSVLETTVYQAYQALREQVR
ncbi:MAG: hypothetical protein GF401_11145 [Chitinivibrionales bacterium]|nr:hypothetical protein [Chitinivibrionales bacterium]